LNRKRICHFGILQKKAGRKKPAEKSWQKKAGRKTPAEKSRRKNAGRKLPSEKYRRKKILAEKYDKKTAKNSAGISNTALKA
jgi:hypothetical protein